MEVLKFIASGLDRAICVVVEFPGARKETDGILIGELRPGSDDFEPDTKQVSRHHRAGALHEFITAEAHSHIQPITRDEFDLARIFCFKEICRVEAEVARADADRMRQEAESWERHAAALDRVAAAY